MLSNSLDRSSDDGCPESLSQATIWVLWNVFCLSKVHSRTSMLSQEKCVKMPGDIFGGMNNSVVELTHFSNWYGIQWLAAWTRLTSFSDRVAWWSVKPNPMCFGFNLVPLDTP